MPSPILARADALMHRKRQNDELDDVPVLTDAIGDDDIPVLLDAEDVPPGEVALPVEWPEEAAAQEIDDATVEPVIVAAEPAEAAPPETAAAAPAPALDPGLRDLLVHELARRVEQRLSAELPRIIESTVRDFLAEQEMISGQTAPD